MIEKILEKFGYCQFEDAQDEKIEHDETFETVSYKVVMVGGSEVFVKATHQSISCNGDLYFEDQNRMISESTYTLTGYFKREKWKYFVLE